LKLQTDGFYRLLPAARLGFAARRVAHNAPVSCCTIQVLESNAYRSMHYQYTA
jgi:hypothetical protein